MRERNMQGKKKLVAAVLAGVNSSLLLGIVAAVPMAAVLPASVAQAADVAAGTTADWSGQTLWEDSTVEGSTTGGTMGKWVTVSGSTDQLTINKWGGMTLKANTDKDTPTATNTVIEGGTEDGCKGQQYVEWLGKAEHTTVQAHAQQIVEGWSSYAYDTTIESGGTMIVGSSDNATAKAESITNNGGMLSILGSGAVVNDVTLASGSTVTVDNSGAWLGGTWSFYDDLLLNANISGNSTFTFNDTKSYHTLNLGTVDGNMTFNLNSDLANNASDKVTIAALGKDVTSDTTATVKFYDKGLTTGKNITGSAVFATAPSGLTFKAAEVESGSYRYLPTITSTANGDQLTWTLTTLTNLTPATDTGKSDSGSTDTGKTDTGKDAGDSTDTARSIINDFTILKSGETAKHVQAQATYRVGEGASVDDVQVVKGGDLQVMTGGTAKNTTLTDGFVDAYGGTITDTKMTGGTLSVNKEGSVVTNTQVNGGKVFVYADNTIKNTTIGQGGRVEIASRGMVDGVTVQSGGTLKPNDRGAIIKDATLQAGAKIVFGEPENKINLDQKATVGGNWLLYGDQTIDGELDAWADGVVLAMQHDTDAYHTFTLKAARGDVTYVLNTDLAKGLSDKLVIQQDGKTDSYTTEEPVVSVQKVQFQDAGFSEGQTITGTAQFATTPETIKLTALPTESGAYSYTPTVTSTTSDGKTTWTLTTLTETTQLSDEQKAAIEKAAQEAAAKAKAEAEQKAAALEKEKADAAKAAQAAAEKAAAEKAAQEAAEKAAAEKAAQEAEAKAKAEQQVKQQKFAASTTVKVANDQAASMAVVFRGALNNVERRLGDLRQATGRAGAWGRYYHAKEEAQTGGHTTHISSNSVQVGWDRDIDVRSGRMFYGYALGYTDGSMGLYRGAGDYTARTAAAYGSWLGKHGHFSDIIFKYGWLSNDYHSVDESGTDAAASFDAQAFSLSAEYGRRITGARGFFVEPQVELTVGRVGQETWVTSNNVTVHSDNINSVLGRVGVELGQQVKDAWNWYGRVSLVREFNAESRVTSHSGSLNYDVHDKDNLHETYLEWSLGFNSRLSSRTNCYVEYMGTNGDKTKTDYQLNAGFRWNF